MEKAIRLCEMVKQGYNKGACEVKMKNGLTEVACKATLKYEGGQYHRVISAMHLSRPEDYFSIYQSGCNHNCLKCHSWEFSKHFNGKWYSTDEIAEDKEMAISLFKKAKKLETLAYRVKDEREHALYNKAIAYYLQVARDYKGLTKYPPEALYRTGKIYYKYLKRYGDAESIFQEIIQEYPEKRYAKKALKYLKKINRMKVEE